ncbi:hypothetical protein SeMB42_g01535 [Synchytrium endobioticum]|uniref:Armadillo repeat-containing domain-containing protein n=1 Tax=Synchytrium endobioticum TaxID=286115 RepID=A0A507DKQ5_9FUNG|nr:hypothetical protein SeLEV6574_g04400 [Synchytrium endobioticum]TPX52289.1 hypothetical protein SeMB42_g01535 [Synchytrium endobioticum]
MMQRRNEPHASTAPSRSNLGMLPALGVKRETVLDIVSEARASLQKPSRPFTPAAAAAATKLCASKVHSLNRVPLPPPSPPSPDPYARPTTPRRLGPLRPSPTDTALATPHTHRDYRDLRTASQLSVTSSDDLLHAQYNATASAHDDFGSNSATSSRTASAKTLAPPSSDWTHLLSVLSLPQNPLDRAWDVLEGMNWLRKSTQSNPGQELEDVTRQVAQKLNMWIAIGRDQHSQGGQNEASMRMVWDACALAIKVASTNAAIIHALEIMSEVGTGDFTPSRRSIVTVLELTTDTPSEDTAMLSLQESAVSLLKSLALSDTGRDVLVSQGGVKTLANGLRKAIENADSGDYKGFVSEATATLRNIVADPTTCSQFVKARAIVPLLDILDQDLPYSSSEEAMWHASRVLSKLSTDATCLEAMAMCRVTIPSIVGVIVKYQTHQPLLVRLLFVLGNLTCIYPSRNHEKLSEFVCDIVALLDLYAQEAFRAHDRSSLSEDHVQILVKLVRLMANMALDKSLAHDMLGMMELENLVELLDPSFENEELLLNVVSALANLTFYTSILPNSISGKRMSIAERVTNHLVHENTELVIEGIRVIANISRFPDARDVFASNKAPEIICLLSAHQDRDIAFQACGAIINMAADPDLRSVLVREGATDGLTEAMANVLEEHDWEFGCVVAQAISNLGRDAIDDKMLDLLDIAYDVAKTTPAASSFSTIISQLTLS